MKREYQVNLVLPISDPQVFNISAHSPIDAVYTFIDMINSKKDPSDLQWVIDYIFLSEPTDKDTNVKVELLSGKHKRISYYRVGFVQT